MNLLVSDSTILIREADESLTIRTCIAHINHLLP